MKVRAERCGLLSYIFHTIIQRNYLEYSALREYSLYFSLTFFVTFIQCTFYFLHIPMPAKSLKKLCIDLLDVSVGKSLFNIAFPSILAGLLQTGFLMTSTYWMGKI